MMLALGAATSAIDSLFGLVSAKQTPSAGAGQDQANLFAFQADAATSTSAGAAFAAGGHARISPETMSALLTAQGQSGASFTPMSTGLPNTMVFDLAMSADGQHLFAATETGPYYYDSAAGSWQDIGLLGAPEQEYWDVDFVDTQNIARFSTYGRGIWDFTIVTPGVLYRNGFE